MAVGTCFFHENLGQQHSRKMKTDLPNKLVCGVHSSILSNEWKTKLFQCPLAKDGTKRCNMPIQRNFIWL